MATLETYTYDNLIAGDFPITTDRETLTTGQNLTRGALLGKITASGATQGELKQCDSSATDGSQTPYAILAEDANATSAAAHVDVYKTGSFNGAAIGLATGDDIDDFKDTLRDLGIIIVTTQGV